MNGQVLQQKSKTRGILLVLMLIGGLFLSSCGGNETKTYRVGVLIGLPFLEDMVPGFEKGMAELGYVEGENIVYDVQRSGFDIPTYQSILQKFVDDEVDLILVGPTEAAIEAKAITAGTDIPVVFVYALIEGMDIADSIKEPGGNITGVRLPGPDWAALKYETMRDMVPNINSILIPYQVGYPIVQPQLNAIYPLAEADGITLIEVPVNSPEELAAYLNGLSDDEVADISAMIQLAEPLVTSPETFDVMTDFAKGRQIPIGGFYFDTDDYTSVFGMIALPSAAGELAAPLVDKIFQGIDPGTIPVVSTELYMDLDYRMAQELGLEVPERLLALADQIYR